MATYLIHQDTLNAHQFAALTQQLGVLSHCDNHWRTSTDRFLDVDALNALRQATQLDINALPQHFDPAQIGLLISDMDSTLITIECIDEIADFANIKPQIADITEAAMRGELDFTESLHQRVKLLTDLTTDSLDQVYQQRLTLSPGAEVLMAKLQHLGIKRALVSGGFTYFTDRLKDRLQLDHALANELGRVGDKLTGSVVGEVVDGQGKATYLAALCAQHRLSTDQAIAVGDGANDLPMMAEAGLSVAYHAKPKVQAKADVVLNHRGLDAILDFLQR